MNENITKGQEQTSSALKEGFQQSGKMMENCQKKVGHAIEAVDRQLHSNPWPVVAGIAVGSYMLGCLMGKSSRRI